LVFLTTGTGLGGGIIIDGQIYRGTTDTAGEVGHVRLAEQGPVEYGKAGSWEAFCSGSGMVKLAHSMFPGHYPEALTTRELVTQALNGEEEAKQVIRKSGEWLGRGLAILVDTLNPQMIVLGSLGGALGDLFIQPARDVVKAESLAQPAEACRIVPAELGARLGDVAALVAAIYATRQSGETHAAATTKSTSAFSVALEDTVRVQARLSEVSDVIEETARVICRALVDGRKVIVFGNGGSAAQAQHLAGELVGKYGPVRKSLPSIALTADSGVVTCIANDFGYDRVFSRQVEAFAQPGDVVIGITTSGRSANIIQALDTGRERGAVTIAMTGERGLVGSSADYVVPVPSNSTARIQEGHAFIVHYWCDVIDAQFAK
jgi:phosphoheptose isomerase